MTPEGAERWIFAADSLDGHLVEQKEDRAVLSKYGNDLRQTFRTVGQAAEVSEIDIHILMNHSLQGVNAGYITRSALLEDHLRRQQERISQAVLHAVAKGRGRRRAAVLAWLRSCKADSFLADDTELPLDLEGSVLDEDMPGAPHLSRPDSPSPWRAPSAPARLANWAGDVVGSTKLERDYGIPRTTLHGWQKQHRVVALLSGTRKHVFPLAQFVDGRPVEGLTEVILAAGSPRAAWLWLIRPHSSLDAQAPLDRLKAGDLLAVTRLAENEFHRVMKAA